MSIIEIETCPKCLKKYKCLYIDQAPGCRDTSEKICPHCHAVLKESMEYDFFTDEI